MNSAIQPHPLLLAMAVGHKAGAYSLHRSGIKSRGDIMEVLMNVRKGI